MTDNANRYNLEQIVSGTLTIEHVTELVRQFQREQGLLVDGVAGAITRERLDELIRVLPPPAATWSPWRSPRLVNLPANRAAYYNVFGNPGVTALDRGWERAHIINLHETVGNKLPFVPMQLWIACHELVEPYIREALRRAQLSCPSYAIERIGSFVFRHQQHDKRRPLSAHAFGAAFDINPDQNQAINFAEGERPEPWSPQWYARWPRSIPEGVVRAFESCGFFWGGNWTRPCDPMHFEIRGSG